MKYRNKKTGNIFESNSICVGADIERLDIPAVVKAEEKPKPKKKKAKE